MKSFRHIQVEGAELWTWQRPVVPDNPPSDKAAFRIKINFPAGHPLKPIPNKDLLAQCYDEKGQVCLPIISAENWKPATKTYQGIQSLTALVNDPQPKHPLRDDLAEKCSKDHKESYKNAEEFTKTDGEKRLVD
ncbi:ubiquitin-conjugating enzyme E2 L3-like [Ochotona princeps]|uniref:ubiquitin-conjugating enzyme E2 L3-like n=1 Tax=Ochotona princeps TaxID=9978 RepID=UPI002715136D|nr:ubiquitin-conjugating enzyme E2 L3-like [Ochotona princeps]